MKRTYRFKVYDRAVGHDGVVSFHQVQFTLIICSIRKAVDRAALRASTDRHAGDGLVTSYTVYRACTPSSMLRLLHTKIS